MKKLSELSRAELEGMIAKLVLTLWADDVKEGGPLGFAPDRQWTQDEIEIVGDELANHGLRPEIPDTPDEARQLMSDWLGSGRRRPDREKVQDDLAKARTLKEEMAVLDKHGLLED